MSRLFANRDYQTPRRRYTKTLAFQGIDNSSPYFSVEETRALDANNYIWRNGKVEKRYGIIDLFPKSNETVYYLDVLRWREISTDLDTAYPSNIKGTYVSDTVKMGSPDNAINGMWTVGYITFILKGSLLYYYDTMNRELTLVKTQYSLTRTVNGQAHTVYQTYSFANGACYGVVANNKLWLFDGKCYVVVWTSGSLDDDNLVVHMQAVSYSPFVFIPTTTIGITPSESGLGRRENLQAPNLLTPFRKNKLATVKVDDMEGDFYTYVLDGSINVLNFSDENFSIEIEDYSFGAPVVIKSKIEAGPLTDLISGTPDTQTGKTTLVNGLVLDTEIVESSDNIWIFDKTAFDSQGNLIDPAQTIVYGYLSASNITLQAMSNGNTSINFVKRTMDNVNSGYLGNNNITVKFVAFDLATIQGSPLPLHQDTLPTLNNWLTNIKLICNCRFGILFGTSNARNRLFVSGNEYKKNIDWHSGDDDGVGDLGYFPADSNCAYGTNESAVVGYSIISDGRLAVFKQKKGVEPTLYYRTGSLTTVLDSTGNQVTYNGNTLYKESFPVTITNARIGAVSWQGVNNFCGDTLFITDTNQVCGLDNKNNVADNQRVASSRTKSIDKSLQTDKPYIILEEDTKLFVATDDHLWISEYGTNYEWFKTDIANISCMAKLCTDDGVDEFLIFGTKDGRIVMFNDNVFVDKEIAELTTSESAIITQDNLDTTITTEKNNKLVVSRAIINKLKNGSYKDTKVALGTTRYKVYYTSLEEPFNPRDDRFSLTRGGYLYDLYNLLNENTTYTLVSAFDNTTFNTTLERAVNENGRSCWHIKNPSYQEYSSLMKVYVEQSATLKVLDFDEENNTITLETIAPNAILCNDGQFELLFNPLTITYGKPVISYYVTAPFAATDLSSLKTIWSYTLIADTGETSNIGVAKVTDDKSLEALLHIPLDYDGKYDYTQYSYARIDYQKYKIPKTYTVFKPFSVNYVCFRFSSIEPENSVLTSMQFNYSITKRGMGRQIA